MVDDRVVSSIVAALQAGDALHAEEVTRRALESTPDEPDLLVLLGLALQRQARLRDALVPFARLTELRPRDDVHWENYAKALHRVGDVEAAREAVGRAVELAPDEMERLQQLGLVCLELAAPRAGRAALLRAVDQSPDSAPARIHAARASVACSDSRAADLLVCWRKWLPLSDTLQLELADLLTQVSESGDAVELLEDLVQRKPTNWSAQLLLARVYERVNQPECAEDRLNWIAAMRVSTADAAWVEREIVTQRAQFAMRRRDYAVARMLLENAGPDGPQDASYYFSLGQACDRLGEVGATIDALGAAHTLQTAALRLSNPSLLESHAPLLPGIRDRVSVSDYRAWPPLIAPEATQSPVFVVGFPRSGTTLLEQMLDAHPRLQSMDERPFLNLLAGQLQAAGIEVPQDIARLSQRDCDELRKGYVLMGCQKIKRQWDTRLVDKNPLNMLWLPMVHRLFPQARIILAVRHPCDVIWSCYLQNFRAASLVAACRSLEHLAHAYVAAMRNWLHHVEVFHPDVFVSRYEDLVADTPAQARRIGAFLGIEDADAMLSFAERAREKGFIKTPSYTQVIEPINARGVGHWQPYRPYFDGVLSIVQPMLEHWGYDERPIAAGPVV